MAADSAGGEGKREAGQLYTVARAILKPTFRFLWPETPGPGKEVGAWGIAR